MHRNKIHRIYSKIGQIYIAARAEVGGGRNVDCRLKLFRSVESKFIFGRCIDFVQSCL